MFLIFIRANLIIITRLFGISKSLSLILSNLFLSLSHSLSSTCSKVENTTKKSKFKPKNSYKIVFINNDEKKRCTLKLFFHFFSTYTIFLFEFRNKNNNNTENNDK